MVDLFLGVVVLLALPALFYLMIGFVVAIVVGIARMSKVLVLPAACIVLGLLLRLITG